MRQPEPNTGRFVIVGAGQAGAQAALTLRDLGFAGAVVLLGDEPHAPYARPPLSKKLLAGELAEERLYLRPPALYADRGIDLRLATQVLSIDRQVSCVHIRGPQGAERIAYNKLLLATGARARELPLVGARHDDVLYLRSWADSIALRARLAQARHLVVIGGGYVGLEVAATAAAAAFGGLHVTVLERAARLLERVTTPIISEHVEQAHRRHGVEVHCGVRITGLAFEGERLRAVQTDGGEIVADLVLVGIGAAPNVALALEAGLACDDGIVVDAGCRTSDPAIYAAGDCTRHPNALYGRRLRLESVQNAVDQAGVAAAGMAGIEAAYTRVPWFWSQQYGLKLQSAGLSEGHDEIIERGERAADRFALLYRRGGQLIGVDAVNHPAEYLAARRAIAERGELAVPKRAMPAPSPSSQAAPGPERHTS